MGNNIEKQNFIPSIETENVEFIGYDELINNSDLPTEDSRENIKKILKLLDILASGVGDANIKNELASYIVEKTELKYQDTRKVFKDLEKFPKSKTYVSSLVGEMIDNGKKNFVRLSIDVEGLKAINDVAGKENGDLYLLDVYKALERTVQKVKAGYKGLAEDEIIISAEGGDEFGILISRNENKEDLGKSRYAFVESGNQDAEMSVSQLILAIFNDELSEIAYKKYLSTEKIVNGLEAKYKTELKRKIEIIDSCASLDDKPIRSAMSELDIEPDNGPESDKNKQLKYVKTEIIRHYKEKTLADMEEAGEIFAKYDFFASASAGELYFNSDFYTKAELSDMTRKIADNERKNNPAISEDRLQQFSKNRAMLNLFFWKADERMIDNKKIFKNNLRLSGVYDKEGYDEFLKRFKASPLRDKISEESVRAMHGKLVNLFRHSLFLSRNDEQSKTQDELADARTRIGNLEKIQEIQKQIINQLKSGNPDAGIISGLEAQLNNL